MKCDFKKKLRKKEEIQTPLEKKHNIDFPIDRNYELDEFNSEKYFSAISRMFYNEGAIGDEYVNYENYILCANDRIGKLADVISESLSEVNLIIPSNKNIYEQFFRLDEEILKIRLVVDNLKKYIKVNNYEELELIKLNFDCVNLTLARVGNMFSAISEKRS